jgi:hypothetical protein
MGFLEVPFSNKGIQREIVQPFKCLPGIVSSARERRFGNRCTLTQSRNFEPGIYFAIF